MRETGRNVVTMRKREIKIEKQGVRRRDEETSTGRQRGKSRDKIILYSV